MINQEKLDELEALAKIGWIDDDIIASSNYEHNANYIAAANPDMVLEMIEEIKRLRQETERLNAEADWLANNVEFGCPDEVDHEAWWYEICKHDDCKGQKEDVGACWRRAAQRWITMQKAAQALPSRVTARDDGK